jgi:hypothetical protein
MGKALPSSDNRIQPGCGDDGGDGGSMAMAARRGRRRGKGGGDGGSAARAAAMAAARRRWRRRWRGQGGESMDEAGRGGGKEEKTVALCGAGDLASTRCGEEGSGLCVKHPFSGDTA